MKKVSVIILTILIIINSVNFVSCADCNMNINYEKFIDFSEIIEGKAKSITQTIDDKEITITGYEQISKINLYFEKKFSDRIKKFVKNRNSDIDTNVFIHIFDKAMDLLIHTAKTGANALNQIEKIIDDETLNKLNEKEQEEAAVEGRDSAIIPTLGATTLGATL